ncbi:MAG: Holliday junction branch migration protein RuvA [Patescibacteria group bacterium]
MIGFLSGKVIAFLNEKIIVRLPSGLGYIVTVDPELEIILNENLEMFVLEVIRDGNSELYGFRDIESRLWVEKLIDVDGVGPKSATNMIYFLGVSKLKTALAEQDDVTLSSVKGISSKTAKKIILELHNKEVNIKTLNQNKLKSKSSSIATEFTETLSSLGYSRSQIVNVIGAMKQEDNWQEDDLNHLVRMALKYFRS